MATCNPPVNTCLTQACQPVGGGQCGWTAWVSDSCTVTSDGRNCILGTGAPIGAICSSGGGGGGPTPTPSGGGGGGGWGACGSCSNGFCSGHPASECQLDPGGVCQWNPGGCGGGGGVGSQAFCTVALTPAVVNTTVGASSNLQVNYTYGSNSGVGTLDRLVFFGQTGNISASDGTIIGPGGYNIFINRTAGLPPQGGVHNQGIIGAVAGNTTMQVAGVMDGGARTCWSNVINASVTAAPTCSIFLSPAGPLSVNPNSTTALITSYSDGTSTMGQVTYTNSNPLIGSFPSNYTPPAGSPYSSNFLAGGTSGQTTIQATGYIGGVPRCISNPVTLDVIVPTATFQILDGDIVSAVGGISENMSAGQYLISGTGTPVYSGAISTGSGAISTSDTNAQSSFSARMLNYTDLVSYMPTAVNTLTSPLANNGQLNSGSPDARGYTWFNVSGDLTISGNIQLPPNGKYIVYVSGNVVINGRVNYSPQPETNIFMLIAQNSISVNGALTNGASPALEGVYFTGNTFSTGAGNTLLHVKGAVYAQSLQLQRNIQSASPSEIFEFDPDLLFNYPQALSPNKVIWREVAP